MSIYLHFWDADDDDSVVLTSITIVHVHHENTVLEGVGVFKLVAAMSL